MQRQRAAGWHAMLAIHSLLVLFNAGCSSADEALSPVPGPAPTTIPTMTPTTVPTTDPPPKAETLTVHYYRPMEDYDTSGLTLSGDVADASPLKPAGTDAFGIYFSVPLKVKASQVGVTVLHAGTPDPSAELAVNLAKQGKEVWVYAGSPTVYTAAPAIPEKDTAIVYYRRLDDDYTGYGVYAWSDTTDMPTWDNPIPQAGVDQFGAYFKVNLKPNPQQVGFIIHQGNNKDPGPDQLLTPPTQGRRIWVVSGENTIYTYPAAPALIDATRAHWVSKDTIAWNLSGDDATLMARTYALNYAPTGGLTAKDGKIQGGSAVTLTYDKAGLSAAAKAQFPHLAAYKTWKLNAADLGKVPELLKGQLLVSTSKLDGSLLTATGLQIPGVLDELYTYSGALGVVWSGGAPTLKVWAPTAISVKAHIFDDAKAPTASKVVSMVPKSGVFSADGDASWKGKFYLYEVEVYVHSTGKVEHTMVTDPYSVSLSANSQRSQIVDLSDPTLSPPGFGGLVKPPLAAPGDISLYELHVRDFSVNDTTVPAIHRGTFLAFTDTASNGMKHLSGLAAAGLTHVHLLPIFDFATVNEVKSQQLSTSDLSIFAPESDQQQAAVKLVKTTDGFNWGYDPFHFTTPEGSYATDPDGSARVIELRQMVKSLNEAGLRVVMDVVYNHTSQSGQDPKSVLDRIVPGYYHRLDDKGAVATSTCCQNTATEHAMMEKLMVDSVVTWARDYKIDGFRFDLMGHHMKSNMLKVRSALSALSLAKEGVDGKAIYVYGEGWDFGEVSGNARGVNATQKNMAGTGIGTFNDRLRDAVRGGGPFDSGKDLMKQGFVNGLFSSPNDLDQGTPAQQKATLLLLMDQIRVGLTGNLATFPFQDRSGNMVTGVDVDYNGQPTGYTDSPVEAITYAEAHDNQTLFDIMQYKAPAATDMKARVQMQDLALSILSLGQGVPFYHAGMEMLRSKSMDRDSYDSSDWYNKLDFSYASNNWAVGLPPEDTNGANWSLIKPLFLDPARRPAKADILASVKHLERMLQIRKSTKLLRLGTKADVLARVRFHNTGASQIPGLIVMSISDEVPGKPDLDPSLGVVVALFNATNQAVMYADPTFAASVLSLHPVQAAAGADPVVASVFNAGSFTIPPRVTAVFIGTGNFP